MKIVLAGLCLAFAPHIAEAQGRGNSDKPKVKHQKDGDMTMESEEGKLKVDKDGDAKLKLKDGRKIKVDKNGEVKKKPREAWERAERDKRQERMDRQGPPDWAPAHGYRRDRHVYFQDYYTFYDPSRGYVYWQDNQWVSSPILPQYLNGVDLRKARVHVLDDVELNVRPEGHYHRYRELYPAQRVEITVPVPAQ